MSNTYAVFGNLALACEDHGTRFTVIDGGASEGRRVEHGTKLGLSAPLRFSLALITAAILVAMFASLIGDYAAFNSAISQTELETIVVDPGQSLWTIAEEHPVPSLDTDRAVDAIMEWNGLTRAGLSVGQELLVPKI